MNCLAKLLDASKTGVPAVEALLPSPDKGGADLSALISHQQLILRRDTEGLLLGGTMVLAYGITQLGYVVSTTLHVQKDRACLVTQLVCQVDATGSPITTKQLLALRGASREEKREFLESERKARQWNTVDPVELTESPTFNFLGAKLREALPILYQRMLQYREGDDMPQEQVRELLQLEEPARV